MIWFAIIAAAMIAFTSCQGNACWKLRQVYTLGELFRHPGIFAILLLSGLCAIVGVLLLADVLFPFGNTPSIFLQVLTHQSVIVWVGVSLLGSTHPFLLPAIARKNELRAKPIVLERLLKHYRRSPAFGCYSKARLFCAVALLFFAVCDLFLILALCA